ncbi:MAG: acyl-ACP--UDP-N-acetylglucosamine O-acyltransferase [Muribaculaceae bacterium]|nr:acyl-ACP--UDP-N-acetylglucosamine O-acyltransferase [Muribaculaceae bacterium]MDE5930820.1 acyl-ACP--UDP-N-acetylglucosamine O-acyltransferase [Muribaculaceae bacterium]MDE6131399.1 acyl-ACP--UDP-N-acetylglucosamine O-acyltransferase [Muribaculaceae bacterium]
MISPLAYVDPSAKIADDVKIHPFAYIDADVEIGPGCEIMPNASIMRGTRMGANNKVYQGAVVGADPQDFRWKGQQTYCYIGDNNRIREQCIINRGIESEGGTRIGSGCFIMAESHIGHDSQIADNCVLGNGVKVAGNVRIGVCTILSSNVIINEGAALGECVLIKGGCRISNNVPPFTIMAHNPSRYYGVNSVIMQKCGYTEANIDDVAKAYRHIYQCNISVFNALGRIEADIDASKVRSKITDFIRQHNLRIAGDTFTDEE